MSSEVVLYEVAEHIATITLNRPERLNAYNHELRDALGGYLRQAETDPEVRAVVLTGAGRAFCAGLDLKQEHARHRGPRRPDLDPLHLPYIFAGMDTPLVAAVNGHAVGIGFELTLMCDFRVLAEDAVLNDMHVKRGILPDAGATWLLTRQVGWSRACRVLLLAEPIDAPTAAVLGLADEVVPREQLLPAARDLAARLAVNAPLSVRYTKRAMREGFASDFQANVRLAGRLMGELGQTADAEEGKLSFREKRLPNFTGR
jgi:enoyl-CoA hydratase/carnithine racemase